MNIKRLPIYLASLLLFFQVEAGGYINNHSANVTKPQRLIVKLKPNPEFKPRVGKQGVILTGQADLDRLNNRYDIKSMIPVFGSRNRQYKTEFHNVYLIPVASGVDISTMVNDYTGLDGVEYIEPDYEAEFYLDSDDPFISHQWGLENNGQGHYHIDCRPGYGDDKLIISYGLPGADINARAVLDNPPDGTITAVVAIIDTGVDIDHPDLEGRIWNNPREIPGNDIDDDNNGYVDDLFGWDFSASDEPLEIDLEDNDPTDENGHGTHCAGIIAAQSGNGLGVAGVATDSRIMALKILPVPLTSKIARAIVYAVDNGADVISMSFGFPYRSYLIEEALGYARSRGVINLAASGNSGIEEANFPAAFESVIAVGAIDDSDRVTDFSTFGNHLDICAPGLSILSLRADSTDMYDDSDPGVHIIAGQYYLASGTSMACPMAAGVAADLRSKSAGLTPQKTTKILENTARDYIDPYGNGADEPGWDKFSGYGCVDLADALAAAPNIRAHISNPRPYQIVAGDAEITGYADGDDFSEYIIEYGTGYNPESWEVVTTSLSPVTDGSLGVWNTAGLKGNHTIRLQVGQDNIVSRTVFVANEAVAKIIFPAEEDTVSNILDITAEAYSSDFAYLLLEYRPEDDVDGWIEINRSSIPACDDPIGDWMVEGLPGGDYHLRVSIYSKSKFEIADEVRVHVRSNFSGDDAWKSGLNGAASIMANYGDIDGDGLSEIIVGTSNGIKIFKPDGTPVENHIASLIQNNFQVPIAVGNLDGDGIDDFVALGSNPATLYGFLSQAPVFEQLLEDSIQINGFSNSEHEFPRLFLCDNDYDGFDEIQLTAVDGVFSVSRIFESDGTLAKTFMSASEYLPADLNDDGFYEYYAYFENDSTLRQFDKNGHVINTFTYDFNGSPFQCVGLAAVNIDSDYRPELIAYGLHTGQGYCLYAFDDGLYLKAGWPHDLGIHDYLVPTMPIFGDLDGDGVSEYVSTCFDISVSYVHVWRIDGSSFIPGNPDGLFATIPRPGVLNMPILTDINGDGQIDIVVCANDDLFYTFKAQRIYAWNTSGDLLPGFPFVTVPLVPYDYTSSFRFTPSLGDLDRDGYIDLIMPASDSTVIRVGFEGMSFDSCLVPAPLWRYNRKLNNIRENMDCPPTGFDDFEEPIPDDFKLSQNFPNPFNPFTNIDFTVPTADRVKVVVYNILGREVKILTDRIYPQGEYRLMWDGRDDSGKEVSSGFYFYSLTSGDKTEARKMLLLK
nr:S8 family serine peptidase [candidate division Zixibacteria bacterium]